jgi:ABC-type sulfate/molybdate transport systems ATPase subunit
VLALLGPSGAGKTTLLRTIAGLGARRRVLSTIATWRTSRSEKIGSSSGPHALWPYLSVEEHLADQARARGRSWSGSASGPRAEAARALRRRAPARALARAVARSELLLLEPFTDLDPVLRHARDTLAESTVTGLTTST